MSIHEYDRIYFVGIGGIGMSALARWFRAREKPVAGFDRVDTPLTKELTTEGCEIHFDDDVLHIPIAYKGQSGTLVVYTPAIPSDHQELSFFKENNFTLKKRSEVLGMLTEGHYTIAVAGTHGKTTTSSMIAHLLNGMSGGVTAFVGGIMSNYNSNILIGDENAPIVVEADEFDRSFLQISPNYTVVTSVDADHLDIYESKFELAKAFSEFVSRTEGKGRILMSSDSGVQITGPEYLSYDLKLGDVTSEALRIVEGAYVFTYRKGRVKINDLFLYVPGHHNVMNALAAVNVAFEMGLSDKMIRTRLKTYKGVKRRFEYIQRFGKTVFIDDYAHHPTEITAVIRSVRSLYSRRRLTVVFQPHLFTRTRDFMTEFAESLDLADEVILLPIYPAREKPIKDITSEALLELMTIENKRVADKEKLIEIFEEARPDVLMTLGAGDIDKVVPELAGFFKEEKND